MSEQTTEFPEPELPEDPEARRELAGSSLA